MTGGILHTGEMVGAVTGGILHTGNRGSGGQEGQFIPERAEQRQEGYFRPEMV